MSDHVADRLSAFLDRELTEAEASGVRQHLGECEGCAARLGELQGVDRAFLAALPEAPAEYFDSFAGRVRTRIESARAAPKADRGFRLPTWSWAVAAALLLGVLLPRLPWDAQPQPKAVAERVAPPSLGPMRAEESAPATLDEKLDAQAPAQVAAARPDDTRRTLRLPASPARPSPPATAATPAAPGFARSPDAEPSLRQPAAAPPRAAATAPLEKERESDRFAEANREAQAMVLADAELRSGDDAGARAVAAPGEGSAAPAPAEEARAKKESAGTSLSAPAAAASGGVAAGVRARDRVDPPKRRPAVSDKADADAVEGAVVSRGQESDRAEFETLAARQARTPEELRGLRAALRSFLTRHPSDPDADEVRVLVVAASVELSARTGTADDRAEARREAQAYLHRPDAAQKERVSALLRRLDP